MGQQERNERAHNEEVGRNKVQQNLTERQKKIKVLSCEIGILQEFD